MYTETPRKELCSIKWKDFDKLQTNKIGNINLEIENLQSNFEDTFMNTAGKVLRKTRKHKESETKNRKIKNKDYFSKTCHDKYKEFIL